LYQLRIRGNRDALVQALALSGHRLLLPATVVADKTSDVLSYRFSQ
jgi:hypothetical protein